MRTRTLRGRVDSLETKRLILDDGQFNQGMKVKEFHVFSRGQGTSEDPSCILGLDYDLGNDYDASDNRQIGWAGQSTSDGSRIMTFSLIDPDHVVLRDLYIYNIRNEPGNYLIILEPVSLSDDEAILQLIKERSQDDWK